MIGNSIARQWAERLHIIDENKSTQQVARYGQYNGWLDDQVAITYNPFGKGGVYYVGSYLDENAQARMLTYITELQKIKPLMSTPPNVEVCQRVTPTGRKVYILINHQSVEKKIQIPWAAREHLSGFSGKGQLTLAPYGVAVITKAE
jgi:beta-galactosidase